MKTIELLEDKWTVRDQARLNFVNLKKDPFIAIYLPDKKQTIIRPAPVQLGRRSSPIQLLDQEADRTAYDFTLAWISDTQYYNMSDAYYRHLMAINDFFIREREAMNLQYVFYTGDIVDDYSQARQWARADHSFQILDEAGLPYGVLAGNHDVGHEAVDYTVYGRHFGAHRYEDKPWYGGSYKNNRGHYDLISAGGIDFLMVYMGWAPGREGMAWMNKVLAQYPDRLAILNFHKFLQETGDLKEGPQEIYDQVVAKNPNVRLVLCGHNHSTINRLDRFDDDGDGKPDRVVYSMLFDYQGIGEGGMGFVRLLHFDNKGKKIKVRTYSPSLNQYESGVFAEEALHPTGPVTEQFRSETFDIPYEVLGIQARTFDLDTEKAFLTSYYNSRLYHEAKGWPVNQACLVENKVRSEVIGGKNQQAYFPGFPVLNLK